MKLPILLACFLFPCLMHAQSNPLSQKLSRAAALYNDNKKTEADKYLVSLLEKHPDFGEGWDMLVAIRGNAYEEAKQVKLVKGEQKVTVTTTDKNGKAVSGGADSMAQQLMEMINSMSLSKLAFSKYMYTMRQAMLHSAEAYKSSISWRVNNIDVETDTNVSRKALKYYEEAEKQYTAANYGSSARLYRRAIEEQPDFYKAKLYLGDALYASENYADAMIAFQEGVRKFPDQLEPRKYLCDAYAKMKMYDKAVEEAIGAMSVYPDISMAAKMDDAAYLINKRVDIRWTAREVFPNRIPMKSAKLNLNEYSENDKQKPADPWMYYTAALEKAKPYCNEQGIITNPAALGGARYLELYSWQEMLKASKDTTLNEARKMQQAGYLDCYVMVTCFHPDFYDQYKDFAAANKEKISRYYHAFLKELK